MKNVGIKGKILFVLVIMLRWLGQKVAKTNTYKELKNSCEQEEGKRYQKHSYEKLYTLLIQGNVTAWCRMGNICAKATECIAIEHDFKDWSKAQDNIDYMGFVFGKCPFKASNNSARDVARGLSRCHSFAITAKGKLPTALHVDWEKTDPYGELLYEGL